MNYKAYQLSRSVSRVALFSFFFVSGSLMYADSGIAATYESRFSDMMEQNKKTVVKHQHRETFVPTPVLVSRTVPENGYLFEEGKEVSQRIQQLTQQELAKQEDEKKKALGKTQILTEKIGLIDQKSKDEARRVTQLDSAVCQLEGELKRLTEKSERLDRESADLRVKIMIAEADVGVFQKLGEQSRSSLQQAEAELQTLKERQKQIEVESQDLSSHLKRARLELSKAQKEKESMAQKLKYLQAERDQAEEELKKARTHLSKVSGVMGQLETELAEAKKREEAIRRQLVTLLMDGESASFEESDLESLLAGAAFDDCMVQIEQRFRSKFLETEELLRGLQSERDELFHLSEEQRKRIERQERQFQELQEKKEAEIKKLNQRIQKLEREVQKLTKDYEGLLQELTAKEEELSRAYQQKDALQAELEDLKSQHARLLAKDNLLQEQIAAFEQQKQMAETAHASVEMLLKSAQEMAQRDKIIHQQQIQRLEQELAEVRRIALADEEKLQRAYREQIEELGQAHQAALAKVQQHFEEKEKDVAAAQEALRQLSSQMGIEGAARDKLATEVRSAENALKEAQQQAAAEKEQLERIHQQQIQHLKAELAVTKREASTTEEASQRAYEERLRELGNTHDAALAKVQHDLSQKERDVVTAQEALQQLSARVEAIEKEKAELTAKSRRAEDALKEAQQQSAAEKEQLEQAYHQQLEALQHKHAAEVGELQAHLRTSLEELASVKALLGEFKEQSSREADMAASQIQKFKEQLAEQIRKGDEALAKQTRQNEQALKEQEARHQAALFQLETEMAKQARILTEKESSLKINAKALQEAQTERERLLKEVSKQKEELVAHSDRFSSLEQRLLELKILNERLNQEREDLAHAMAQGAGKQKDLEGVLETLNQQRAAVQRDLRKAQADLESERQNVTSLKEIMSRTQSALAAMEAKAAELLEMNVFLNDEVSALQQQEGELSKQHRAEKEQLEKEKGELAGQLEKSLRLVSAFEDQLLELQQKLQQILPVDHYEFDENMLDTLRQISQFVKELQQEEKDLRFKLVEAEDQVVRLKQEKDDLRAPMARLEAQFKDQTKDLEAVESLVAEKEKTIADLERALRSKEQIIVDQQEQQEKLYQETLLQDERIEALEQQIRFLLETKAGLEAQIAALEERWLEQSHASLKLEREVETLSSSLSRSTRSLKDLESEADSVEDLLLANSAVDRRLRAQLEKSEEENERLKGILATAKQLVETMQAESEDELKRNLEHSQSMLTDLRSSLEESQRERDQLKTRLEQLRESLERERSENVRLQAEQEKTLQEYEKLKKDYASLKEELEAFKRQNEMLNRSLTQVQAQKDSLAVRAKMATEREGALLRELADMKAQFQQMTQQNGALQHMLRSLEAKTGYQTGTTEYREAFNGNGHTTTPVKKSKHTTLDPYKTPDRHNGFQEGEAPKTPGRAIAESKTPFAKQLARELKGKSSIDILRTLQSMLEAQGESIDLDIESFARTIGTDGRDSGVGFTPKKIYSPKTPSSTVQKRTPKRRPLGHLQNPIFG